MYTFHGYIGVLAHYYCAPSFQLPDVVPYQNLPDWHQSELLPDKYPIMTIRMLAHGKANSMEQIWLA